MIKTDETEIVRMRFGSHVYGTNTPKSDEDFKVVFIPNVRDILLQRATKTSRNHSTGDSADKNVAGDVDVEEFSLHGYLKLLCDGQTVALDMLFVPDEHILETTFEWSWLCAERESFISRNVAPFVGYCRAQANKYGIKGSRMAAAKAAMEFFNSLPARDLQQGGQARIRDFEDQLAPLLEMEHVGIELRYNTEGHETKHFSVCGKMAAFSLPISQALRMYEGLWQRYGERSRQAMNNDGIDWKALMHARRICDQAIELLDTGKITFPRPNADDLLKIRLGERPYSEVAEEIEEGMVELEIAMAKSKLQDKPNRARAENFIMTVYGHHIRGWHE